MSKGAIGKTSSEEKPTLFDIVKEGLEETIAYSRGEKALRVTEVVVTPPPQYTADGVQGIRKKLNVSQAAFASILGVSVTTVHSWEQGRQVPSRQACRLLEVADRQPKGLLDLVIVHRPSKVQGTATVARRKP